MAATPLSAPSPEQQRSAAVLERAQRYLDKAATPPNTPSFANSTASTPGKGDSLKKTQPSLSSPLSPQPQDDVVLANVERALENSQRATDSISPSRVDHRDANFELQVSLENLIEAGETTQRLRKGNPSCEQNREEEEEEEEEESTLGATEDMYHLMMQGIQGLSRSRRAQLVKILRPDRLIEPKRDWGALWELWCNLLFFRVAPAACA